MPVLPKLPKLPLLYSGGAVPPPDPLITYFHDNMATNPFPDGTGINGRAPSIVSGTGTWANGSSGFNGLVTFVDGNAVRGAFGGSASLMRMDGQAVPAEGAMLSVRGTHNSTTENNAALVCRFNNNADFYRIVARLNPATIVLQKRVGGVTTDLASIANSDAIFGEEYVPALSVKVLPDRVQLHIYSNGSFKHEVEDTAVDRITSFTSVANEVATNARLLDSWMTNPDHSPVQPSPPPMPTVAPYNGVYVGASSNTAANLAEWEAFVGFPVDSIAAHGDNGKGRADPWTWWENSASYLATIYGPIARTKTFSIPLIVFSATPYEGRLDGPDSNLADAAAGLYNSRYTAYAATLLTAFGDQPEIIVRTGEEFNGNWFPWGARDRTTEYIGAYQQFVTTFRAAAVAAGKEGIFKFEWNVSIGNQGMNPETAYPGDEYVDIIGMDFYWDRDNDPTDQDAAWSFQVGRTWGLQWHINFCTSHGKLAAYSEWGVDSNEADRYVTRAANWFNDHNVRFVNYWNTNSAYPGKLSDGQYPVTGAAYVAAFNPEV